MLLTTVARGQTRPHLNNYLFNYYAINPAIAGIEDYIDMKSSFRSQWTGLEGAPETLFLSIHGNIDNKGKTNPANPVKPRTSLLNSTTVDLDGYNARPHHGVGGYVMADRVGPFSKFQLNASYDYHIPLSKKYRLGAGISLGFIHNRLDRDKIILQDQNDAAVNGERYTNTNPDLSLGLWLYSKNLFAGISGGQLFEYNAGFGEVNEVETESYRYLILTAGYKFYVNYNFVFTPSVTLRQTPPSPMVVDFNAVFSLLDRVSVGLTYRSNQSYAIATRFVVNPLFEFGYSFDYGATSINLYNQGSHELYIGFRFNNNRKILCPVLL